jgi:hypothetical protein
VGQHPPRHSDQPGSKAYDAKADARLLPAHRTEGRGTNITGRAEGDGPQPGVLGPLILKVSPGAKYGIMPGQKLAEVKAFGFEGGNGVMGREAPTWENAPGCT